MSRKEIKEIIIGVLAIASIVLVAVESLAKVSQTTLAGIYITDLIICIIFAADFGIRMKQSESKSIFFRNHWYEILAMIPALVFYTLGNVSGISAVFRSLRLIRVVRVLFLLARMGRFFSSSSRFLQRSNILLLFFLAIGVIFLGAYGALVLESGYENALITNFWDAVWWSIATITTVGYGDIVPKTIAGRFMGMGLMVVGIGIMTALITQVSATLVESRLKRHSHENDLKSTLASEIKNRIDNIDKLSRSEVDLLCRMIQTLKENTEDSTKG